MQIRLTKEFSFEMAHALPGYDGKCQNIHGHSYKLYVTVEGEPISDLQSPKDGMVVDFGDIKRIVNRVVIDRYDHALVLPQGHQIGITNAPNLIEVPFQPTTENLLCHFAAMLQPEMPKGVRLFSLRLYETATSYAELFV